MRAWVTALFYVLMLCLPGCGDKTPKAINDVGDAAAKKAERVENFAKDRLQVSE